MIASVEMNSSFTASIVVFKEAAQNKSLDVALLLCTSTAIKLVPFWKYRAGKSNVPVMGSSPAYVEEYVL